MHELSIAESILDCVREKLESHPGAKPLRVGIKVGSMAAIDASALQFCFETIVLGTDWESLELVQKVIPAHRICSNCGNNFEVEAYNIFCPACQSDETEPDGGDELDMDFLEMDTDGTAGTEVQSPQ
jgi:hydrogenase nickel incorporation protein HypA/HybF